MKEERARLSMILVPLGVFAATVLIHYLWLNLHPQTAPKQSPWMTLPPAEPSWLKRYLDNGDYWLSYSYGASFAFAAAMAMRFFRKRSSATAGFALGGVTFGGVLATIGCYFLGCCGSPMLAVYLSLFGAAFLPFAKPLVAAVTTLLLSGAWWWMVRLDRKKSACRPADACSCR